MPGKKGFGDTRKKSSQSPAYKKQKFGARSPFIMKSALKQVGMVQRVGIQSPNVINPSGTKVSNMGWGMGTS